MRMKLFSILVVMLLSSVEASAQSFICTNVIAEFANQKEEQEAKEDMLGSVLKLKIFDNDIKISIQTQDEIERGSKRDRSAVLTKHKYHNYYEASYKGSYTKIEIDKILGFVRGLKLTMKNGTEEIVAIFDREVL